MYRWLYNLCFPLVFLVLLPGYLARMLRRGDYRAHFGQRLGWYGAGVRRRLSQGPPRMWLQAVSVGEILVALKLIQALRERSPGLPLVLSTTTTTGFRLAKERAGQEVEVIYSPIDLLPCVRRAFRVLRPSALVIVDGGLWPNQLWEARRLKIPTALVNARLSPPSERRFLKFRRMSAGLFRSLDLVSVPEAGDVDRWAQLGVPQEQVRHTGSIKYDDDAPAESRCAVNWRGLLDAAGVFPERLVLLAGSTHPGEERILAETYLELRKTFADLFLIIAPRHVERTKDILDELQPLGLRIVRRSELTASLPSEGQRELTTLPTDVLLLDSTGELNDWYAAATIVFIGKSLTAIGGHNPAEAITVRKPVIVGPHMENFAGLMDGLLGVNAIVQIRDRADLSPACARLLSDPNQRVQIAESAYRQLQGHRGAAARNAALLLAGG